MAAPGSQSEGGQDGGAPEAHPGVVYAMLLQPKSVSIDAGVVNTDALLAILQRLEGCDSAEAGEFDFGPCAVAGPYPRAQVVSV
jgi:hypothetical protein